MCIRDRAYVSDLTPDEIREYRGTLTEVGKEDPYSKRSVEENLDLFERMKNGEFEDGTKVLRARIDMSSSKTVSYTNLDVYKRQIHLMLFVCG